MSVCCNTKEELAEAIKNNTDCIFVKGDLKNHVIIIKTRGKVAWAVCAVALTVAIGNIITAIPLAAVTGGAGGVTSALTATIVSPTIVMTLGSAAIPAIAIGVVSGGIGALNTLRDNYKITEKTEKYIKLQRK